jgi:hypothetical protein
MYNVVVVFESSSCKNDSAKALTASLSTSRPAIWAEELLHVARNRARARAWMGCVVLIGVGGGVERDRWAGAWGESVAAFEKGAMFSLFQSPCNDERARFVVGEGSGVRGEWWSMESGSG